VPFVSIPCTPVALSDLAGVHVPRRRVDRPLHRVSTATATLDCLAASRALRIRNPRLKPWLETLHWGLAGESRRRSPPATIAFRRLPPLSRALASSAAGSRSDAPDSISSPVLPTNAISR
jgi:hypothetical protein